MGTDKQERHRLKRARKRKSRARQEAQMAHSGARHLRASLMWEDVAQLLDEGQFAHAADAAARAARLAPRDRLTAAVYLEAAEATRDINRQRQALEHYCSLPDPPVEALIRLAHLCLRSGDGACASAVAARARARVPARMKKRQQWLALLTLVETSCGVPRPAAAPRPPRRDPVTLPLFPGADQPGVAPGSTASVPSRPAAAAHTHPAPVTSHPGPASEPRTAMKRRMDPAADQHPPSSRSSTPAAEPEVPPTASPAAPISMEIPLAITGEIAGLDALTRPFSDAADTVRLAVLGAQIRAAESFDRLLSFDHARGLLRFSHQEETARKVLSVMRGRALLADEVGLGKTIEASLVLSEYLLRGRAHRALVLTPPTLVAQWHEELREKFDIQARTTEEGTFRSDPEAFWSGPGVVIASLPTARSARQRALVTAGTWDMLIVDEAHVLKNARTESYALVAQITSRFLLLLTATPVENRVEELYNLVSLIRPGHLGSRSVFVRRFADAKGRPNETARREAQTLLGEIMIRNTRALSGVQLPPRFARTVLIAPTAAEGELYGHLVTALRAFGPRGSTRLLLSVLLQEAGSSPHAARATLEKLRNNAELAPMVAGALAPAIDCAARLPETGKGIALLRALDGGGATIVFTRFRATLDFLATLLANRGLPYERVDGDLPTRVRHEAIARCQERQSVLLSTEVGSEGLNLQFGRRIVNFDLPWNPARIEQRIGRVHRIGQDHPVEIINFCLAGSIEERILGILDERINLFELIVGEVETILGYLETEREFADLVLDAFAESDTEVREQSFARIGDALAAARTRYRNVNAFDEDFFRNALGV